MNAQSAGEPNPYHAPILVICFNRPAHAAKVIESVKDHPAPIYLFRDGGGTSQNESEFAALFEKTKARRTHPTFIRMEPENLGGRDGPIQAIHWFFSQTAEGIILEEDILPAPGMLIAYSKGLERFRENPHIFALGSSANKNIGQAGPYPWNPSPLFLVWGWASWADRIHKSPIQKMIQEAERGTLEIPKRMPLQKWASQLYMAREMKELGKNPNMCWSYYFQIHSLRENKTILIPETKLTHNIGTGAGALRTQKCADDPFDMEKSVKMSEKEPESNPFHSQWHRQLETAKFHGITHELRNRLQLGTRIRQFKSRFSH